MNINRDYLVTVDVKKSTITNKQSMFFYVLDENTCNIFVQLVFNESNNEIIQKYSAIENAEDYQLEMNIVLADNSCTKLRGYLHNKEEAIFEFEVPNQFVGNYNCELLTSTTINNKKEVITSNKFTYKVKKSVLNDLEEIKDDVQGEPILPKLQADMAQLTEDMAQFTEDIELRAEQLEEDMSLKAEKEHTHNQYLTEQNISHLAPIDNPKFTNSISLGRKEGMSIGINSTALGQNTVASGENSHAEGYSTTASGMATHAEGDSTKAIGIATHAEGYSTEAKGQNAHAEGYKTIANGHYSHVEGYETLASSYYQHVQGTFNIEDTKNTYAHIVGNGYNASNRSNAHTLDWDGNAWFAGTVKIGAGNKELATQNYVTEQIAKAQLDGGDVNLSGYATKTELENKADKEHTHEEYLTEHQDLSDYALKSEIPTDYLTTIPSEYITETELEAKNYLTEHQSLDAYATKEYVDDNSIQYLPIHAEDTGYIAVYIDDLTPKIVYKVHPKYKDKKYLYIMKEMSDDRTQDFRILLDNTGFQTEYMLYSLSNTNCLFVTHSMTGSYSYSGIFGATLEECSVVKKPYYLNSSNTTEYTPTADYHPATKKYVDDAVANVQGEEVNLDGYAKTEDIPTKVSDLENDANYLSEIPSEYITKTELEAKNYLTEHQSLEDYAKKEKFTTVENNTVTTDKYQYINITTDTIINLPSVTEFTEIHLYFNTADDFASAITLSATAQIRYQAGLVFEASNGYEIIATYVPNMNWLVGAVKYEGAVSQASGGAVNPPNVVDPL